MLVLPTSRAGYLLYPVALLGLALRGRRRAPGPHAAPTWSQARAELLVPAASVPTGSPAMPSRG